jgi:hypothetical protein
MEEYMKPHIDKTQFGSIVIEGEEYDHDVFICLDGAVKKRKKKLSKEIYGTSHILSLSEAEYVYEEGAERMIFGTGQSGKAELSNEAKAFFHHKGCQVELEPTPKAIKVWNKASGKMIALFHVTC